MRAYAPSYIKYKNRKLIFNMFLENEVLSRAEITRKTTMSFPTVMKVVEFLLQKNIIVECGDTVANDEGLGRRSKLLSLNANAYLAIGLEFEGKFVHMGLVNLKGDIITERTLKMDNKGRMFDLRALLPDIREITTKNASMPILGIGIGMPAAINPSHNSIVRYSGFNITREKPFSSVFPSFVQELSIPFYIQNDANMACLGEMYLRNAEDIKDLIYISLGTGLGAGIILDGDIRHGSSFLAGEIGKTIPGKVDFRELRYRKSSDLSVQSLINLDAIQNLFKVDIRSDSSLGSDVRQDIADYICEYLCVIVNNLANILDVSEFIIGGIIPDCLGDIFYERFVKYIHLICDMEDIRISPPSSRYSGIIGGAVTVFENVIFDMFEEE